MMRHALAVALFAMPLATAAAPEAEPGLGWLHGEWTGTGTLQGQPTKVTLSVAPAFGGTATTLAYGAQMPSAVFEGRATYRIKARGRVEGQWTDSAGSLHIVGGRIEGTGMTTVWGSPATEIGRSTYKLDKGTLSTSDAVLMPDGSWRVFASASYVRKPG